MPEHGGGAGRAASKRPRASKHRAGGAPHTSTLECSTGVMEHFAITKTADGFHIEGFPDAVKVLRIGGAKVQRLADLALHKVDLDFTLECLETINTAPEEPHTLRRALWHSSIVHFIKCFGQSESRFSLDPKVVCKTDPGAFEPYKYLEPRRPPKLPHPWPPQIPPP
jgi:hypothetical protein